MQEIKLPYISTYDYSERLFGDIGGVNRMPTPILRPLDLFNTDFGRLLERIKIAPSRRMITLVYDNPDNI